MENDAYNAAALLNQRAAALTVLLYREDARSRSHRSSGSFRFNVMPRIRQIYLRLRKRDPRTVRPKMKKSRILARSLINVTADRVVPHEVYSAIASDVFDGHPSNLAPERERFFIAVTARGALSPYRALNTHGRKLTLYSRYSRVYARPPEFRYARNSERRRENGRERKTRHRDDFFIARQFRSPSPFVDTNGTF